MRHEAARSRQLIIRSLALLDRAHPRPAELTERKSREYALVDAIAAPADQFAAADA